MSEDVMNKKVMERAPRGSTRVQETRSEVKGIVFNIQKYSIHDGPGIRTTVFLKGCPLRCMWCSNPESQNTYPEVVHRDSLCTKCGQCVDACREKAISLTDKGVAIDRRRCTNCGECADVCIPGALKMFGDEMSAEEVFREVVKDADFYRNSGGGVTVSGGEPLLQPAFVEAFFKLCQGSGIHTCLETTAAVSARALRQVLPYTSLVLYDIKCIDPEVHRKWIKKSNVKIINNFRLAASMRVPMIVRVPLITGVNNTEKEFRAIADLVSSNLEEPKAEILPYHRYGMGKYQMLDRRYQLPDMVAPTDLELQRAKYIFESYGIDTRIVT
jgi:pyruvate formate lyase activating enzyme